MIRRYWRQRVKTCICVIRHVAIFASFHLGGKKRAGENNSDAMGVTSDACCITTSNTRIRNTNTFSFSSSRPLSVNNKKPCFSDERSVSGTRYDPMSEIRISLSFDASYKFGDWRREKKIWSVSYKPTGCTRVENIFQIYPSHPWNFGVWTSWRSEGISFSFLTNQPFMIIFTNATNSRQVYSGFITYNCVWHVSINLLQRVLILDKESVDNRDKHSQ